MTVPDSVKKMIAITEQYFHKYGSVNPTLALFAANEITTEEVLLRHDGDKLVIADRMVQAAVNGATAVAIISEAWASLRRDCCPEDDPHRTERLVIQYQAANSSCDAACYIHRQRYGRPRLSKWETVMHQGGNTGTFENIFQRAEVRRRTVLTCDMPMPAIVLLLGPTGDCLRNEQGAAFIVSSEVLARRSIELHCNGGEYRCVPVLDHLDMLLNGFIFNDNDTPLRPSVNDLDTIRTIIEDLHRKYRIG
jgi:hypothetical protein